MLRYLISRMPFSAQKKVMFRMKRKKKAYAFVEYNLKNTEILKKKKDEAPGVDPSTFHL